ncbi:hypothetical protein BDD26_1412 [Xenorhabdus cabanillasii]|uniref:Uncharacterized protein n=1 Tax=Xenorhabdus cabanillasii TaxID=351673 RepID=A0A3D9UB63_9GAMM|nr:hypothetical protein [Xenorhabdus cabanillasii]REF26732.1 hypothetical protein BDD26_1412 [Xenorhabdus cabanillasii]
MKGFVLITPMVNGMFFYSQRGMRSGLVEFQTEEDACDYFWNEISLSFSIKES